jgi:hypothetical protein
MGALNFAFDTIVVGALALPWLVLVVDLFVPQDTKGGRLEALLSFVRDNSAVAGVLLVAMAYFMGSAVSRIAQDFFNDDDLDVPVTEENIRTYVYCNQATTSPWLFSTGIPKDEPQLLLPCQIKLDQISGNAGPLSNDTDKETIKNDVRRVFHVQESALLLKGVDNTERLRQLHEQIVVLRGAAFNGLIALSLCVFGWCAKHQSKVRWFLALLPLAVLIVGLYALINHLGSGRAFLAPPFMEFTLLVIAVAGLVALWKGADGEFGVGFVLSLVLTPMAWLGWWWTEILYDEAVIYSFHSSFLK